MAKANDEDWIANLDEETRKLLALNDDLIAERDSYDEIVYGDDDDAVDDDPFAAWIVKKFFDYPDEDLFKEDRFDTFATLSLQAATYVTDLVDQLSTRDQAVLRSIHANLGTVNSVEAFLTVTKVSTQEFGDAIANMRMASFENYCQTCGHPAPVGQACFSCDIAGDARHAFPPQENTPVKHPSLAGVFVCPECHVWVIRIDSETSRPNMAHGFGSHAWQGVPLLSHLNGELS